MATLLLYLALQGVQIKLECADVPLFEAADRALWAFGHHAPWIRDPQASKRVSLSLRWAGYLETLDAIGALTGDGPVESPRHPALRRAGSPSGDEGRQHLLVYDLSSDLRLIATRVFVSREQSDLEILFIGAPGVMDPEPVLKCQVGDHRFMMNLELQAGYPPIWRGRSRAPLHRGDTFRLSGLLCQGNEWIHPFITQSVGIPPHDDFPEPSPARLSLWIFLVGGLALGPTLLLFGMAWLRPKPSGS